MKTNSQKSEVRSQKPVATLVRAWAIAWAIALFLSGALRAHAAYLPSLSMYYGSAYGFADGSVTPTNVRSSNLASGTTDIFTVPAGKRFILSSLNATTTNGTATTGYALLKTNGTYYRWSTSAVLPTNTLSAISIGSDNSFLEAGESIAINSTLVGVNANTTGILFSTNCPAYTPRLLALSAGNNTFYTCPAGKCAVNMPLPNLPGVATPSMMGIYINDSGSTRTIGFYVVPSGGSPDFSIHQLVRTVADKWFYTLYSGVLFPGDSLVISTDANTATQWVRLTVVEIPLQ